ncbi:MAG: Vms1/Ankzf1 family peptidyl-tRNA hydrolase [Nitrolancea sp.]
MMTRDKIEALSDAQSSEWPTISLYLRIDKERIDDDYTIRLKNLLNQAAEQVESNYSHDQREAANSDIERIREFVRDEQDHYGRGLALFVNSRNDLFEAIEIPSDIESRVNIGPRTDVVPLIRLREQMEPFCTCLISRDQARVFYGHMGKIEELSESRDDMVPGQHDQGGWSQARYERHIEEHVRAHFKETASQLFDLAQQRPFRLLVIGGPEEVVAGFVETLHPYVRERHVGSIRILPEANINDVHRESCDVINRWLDHEKQRMIDALRNQAPSGELRATGVAATIEALQRGQIMTLIVDGSFEHAGAICQQCGSLQIPSDSSTNECVYCGGDLRQVDNIVPDIVLGAFRQGARVVFLNSPDHQQQAAEFGAIGAMLRFNVESE